MRFTIAASADCLPSQTPIRLIIARFFRSIGQGALVVDFALYLHALKWSGSTIGSLFMVSMIFNSLLALILGPLSDQKGRKHFLVFYECTQLVSALIAWQTSQPIAIVILTIFGAFGRGANGSPGPFAPVEQSWLTHDIADHCRGLIFSANSGLGFFGMAIGAWLGGIPEWVGGTQPSPSDFRLLFLVVFVGSILSLILLLFTNDHISDHPKSTISSQEPSRSARKQENHLLKKLVIINIVNGIGVGLIGPLLSYWFYLKFGVGPASIAKMMGIAFLITGFAALFSGVLTRRFGVVNVVVWLRFIGLLLLIPMALSPSFTWAGIFYIARSALGRGTLGARQALGLSLVSDARRGLAASLNGVSQMLPFALGPLIAGMMYQLGWLLTPFLLGALLQGTYLWLYRRFFLAHDPGIKSANAHK